MLFAVAELLVSFAEMHTKRRRNFAVFEQLVCTSISTLKRLLYILFPKILSNKIKTHTI